MLHRAVWRPIAIVGLTGVVGLPGLHAAGAQDADSVAGTGSALDRSAYFAQPSEGPAAEGRTAPPVGAPGKEEVPPAGPTLPAPEPARRLDMTSMLAMRSPIIRLASVPNMFGDSHGGYQLQVCDVAGCGVVDIPPLGGTRRVKISENDKALPMDRVFFTYNHFHNALDASILGLGVQSFPIDQYNLGLEKTFREGLWSVELRLPFSATPQIAGDPLTTHGSQDVGNLAVTVKRLLYLSRTTAVGIGLPIDTPTGEDITGEGIVNRYTVFNDAVHLSPFVGFLNAPNNRVFWQGFLQVDVAANGNRVVFADSDLGKLTEQTLLYLDLSWGYWVYRNRCASLITGLAPVIEYHYTTTLDDADRVSGFDRSQLLSFGNTLNRLDISNLTVGLHAELGKTTVRVGGVFPLSDDPDRLYDAEVQVSLNRRY